ncbi:ribonuclease HII [Amylibacter ulvae]|uniref:Ribonuclease HII n=1 Tax=Paramylibacter ulvae TaxID=1651968 RepID=A0ABQ3CW93_9RHOB|nr:ribonuclease HII [Amylibacter ulvae]GHA47026.1 ribonuclease HII [Amylibacter ulvae]
MAPLSLSRISRYADFMTDFSIETALMQSNTAIKTIAGVDEVGRGPWAGPVTACAVILDPDNIPTGLNDSKKLSAKRREALFEEIHDCAQISIAHVEVDEIDRINILQATFRAMERAVAGLACTPDFALIDGNKIPPNLSMDAEAVVKGDAKSASIAAASIIAKVTRDRLMGDLAQQFPGYGWERNAGYGTKIHQLGLRNLGVTPHHRRSFKPIHNILCKGNFVTN